MLPVSSIMCKRRGKIAQMFSTTGHLVALGLKYQYDGSVKQRKLRGADNNLDSMICLYVCTRIECSLWYIHWGTVLS